MSYKRKTQDRKKINNLTAKYDNNRGGFHGKSYKAERTNFKQSINKIIKEVNGIHYND